MSYKSLIHPAFDIIWKKLSIWQNQADRDLSGLIFRRMCRRLWSMNLLLEGFIPDIYSIYVYSIFRPQQLLDVISLINQAERPIILAGYGCPGCLRRKVHSAQFVEAFQIPVLTTWKAIGLMPEEHPLFVGRPGSIGQRGANFAQQNSDLLISIGARLDLDQIGFRYDNFARSLKK